MHVGREDFQFDREQLWQLYQNGLSMGLMSSLVNFGTVVLQSGINQLGTSIIVADTAARKVFEIWNLPISVMGSAMATYCGQNYGAGKYDRIRRGILVCNGISAAVLVVLSWSALAAGKWILGAFCPDQAVVAEGMRIISVTFPVYFVYSLFEVTGGVVR